jgi:hypothetical protein
VLVKSRETRIYRRCIRFSLAGPAFDDTLVGCNRSQALDTPFVLCEERDRLFHEYNSAVLEGSRAVGALADLAGTSSGADYQLLSREIDRAKARLKNARSAYERHNTEHGCGEPTTTRK